LPERISSGCGDDDHEREDAQQGVRGELEGTVDEVNGIEPGPQLSRRRGLGPADSRIALVEQRPSPR
jgi:hypothetical protein